MPTGPSTTGVTGSRPNATQLSFPVDDRVQAKVDVATGNLMVSTNGLSLVGVSGSVPVGATYNSRGWQSATDTGLAHGWTPNFAGTGSLTTTSAGVVLTQTDGSTWVFTSPPSGSNAYGAPAGLKVALAKTSSGFELTDLSSRQVTTFDANGNALSVADKNSNKTVINHDSAGNATSIVSTAGPVDARTATLADNATGYVFSQTNVYSTRNVKYTYEGSSGNLTQFIDALGKTTSFTYSGTDLTKITSPTGATTSFTYSGNSHKVTQVDQSNSTVGASGTSTTRLSYPSATQTLVAGPNTDLGTPVASVPNTKYTIDSAQNLVTKAIDAEGRERGASYNTPYSLDAKTSTVGSTTSSTTTQEATTGTFGQNNNQSLTAVQGQGGATSTTAYGSGSTAYMPTKTTRDSNIAAGGAYSSESIDYGYDGLGNSISSSSGVSGGGQVSAAITRNGDGTVATATAPDNGTNKTVYTYNSNKQLSKITPVTGSGLGVKSFSYDDFGRMSTQSDGAGRSTTYTYDKNDKLLTTAFSDGTGTVTNTYDDAGNLLTQASASGTVTNAYDQLSRLTSTSNSAGGGTISYGYDKASNQTSSTDSLGTYTNTFDNSGALEITKYPKAGGFQYTDYATDDHGRRTDTWLQASGTFDNATTSTYPSKWAGHYKTSYDGNGRVSRIIAETQAASSAPTTVFDTSYCYNAATSTATCSNAKATDTSKLQWSKDNQSGQLTKYAYDNGRIKSVTQSGGSANTTWAYTYDNRGNRLSAAATGATTKTFTYNAANQITNTGYSYDGAGNLTATPTQSFTYNGAQQMTQATKDGKTTAYTYVGAAQNQVLSESTSTGNTYNLVYGKSGIIQYKVNSNVADVYSDPVTGQSTMLTTSSGIACIYVFDGMGNPVGMLTDYATQAFNIAYDPYGVGTLADDSSTGGGYTQNPYSFKGGVQDRASGLVKFGIRWYNPATGTWTQQDTFDAPLDPKNGNRYQFAGSDPINGSDPSGRWVLGGSLQVCDVICGSIGISRDANGDYGVSFGLGTGTPGVSAGLQGTGGTVQSGPSAELGCSAGPIGGSVNQDGQVSGSVGEVSSPQCSATVSYTQKLT
ncbi:RHS repeat-associated protein [Frondihabitans sp. PhB161]|nr:RHS repeat-associated protein [Frondihabitans sp. PhB153]RPF08158.1 RHS repeat-associated protein [Frondihabitans sp. PhB161]